MSYVYVIQTGKRLKIGRSKHRHTRIRDAKTWLPDMTVIGVKPFWNVSDLEKELHTGLAQWWYEGEWFDLGNDPCLESFLNNFVAFADEDDWRDRNSVNFLYWMHDMAEIAMERSHTRRRLRPSSSVAKRRLRSCERRPDALAPVVTSLGY